MPSAHVKIVKSCQVEYIIEFKAQPSTEKLPCQTKLRKLRTKFFNTKKAQYKRFVEKPGEPKEVMNPMFGGKIASKSRSAKKVSSKSSKKADGKVKQASENVKTVQEATPPWTSSRRAAGASH